MQDRLKPLALTAIVTIFSNVYGNSNVKTLLIDKTQPRQTIDCFGASDAWSMDKLGKWPQEQQNEIADWLFSTDNDDSGKPKGIGLSIWRFNLGAGSEEQGDSSRIQSGTRTECFLRSDGTYDWTKQEGQRNFLRLAKQRGVSHFLAFVNSPPVFFTQNGLATNTGRGGSYNLKPECYDDFARYIASSIKGVYAHDGVMFDYLSPVNEPDGHWNWQGPKQEGTPASNREIAKIVKAISRQFAEDSIETKILVDESSDYRCLLGAHLTDWKRARGIRSFFCKDSVDSYLGETPNVPHLVAAHSYWTNTPLTALHDIRCALNDTLKKFHLRFWQTELCIMGNDVEIGGGGGYDFTMKTALYVARVIHHDLLYANASSWQWWRAAGGDYRDGLIRIFSHDGMKTGHAVSSRLMWTLGNYSRFIRPEAVRYEMSASDRYGRMVKDGCTDTTGVMCSAYRNADGTWIMVAINYSQQKRQLNLLFNDRTKMKWRIYRTSDKEGEMLAPVGTCQNSQIILQPRSVTTFVSY
jgi:O-glycosyl hydrolase